MKILACLIGAAFSLVVSIHWAERAHVQNANVFGYALATMCLIVVALLLFKAVSEAAEQDTPRPDHWH